MAKARGFSPKYVLFDGWYASLENLKQVRDFGWHLADPAQGQPPGHPGGPGQAGAGRGGDLGAPGRCSICRAMGWSGCFRIDAPDGDTEYWATNDLAMDAGTRRHTPSSSFAIENYHRDLKQNCGVEKCQVRSERAQRNHIGMAIAGVLAAGVAFLHHRDQRVRGQDEHRGREAIRYLSRKSHWYSFRTAQLRNS